MPGLNYQELTKRDMQHLLIYCNQELSGISCKSSHELISLFILLKAVRKSCIKFEKQSVEQQKNVNIKSGLGKDEGKDEGTVLSNHFHSSIQFLSPHFT